MAVSLRSSWGGSTKSNRDRLEGSVQSTLGSVQLSPTNRREETERFFLCGIHPDTDLLPKAFLEFVEFWNMCEEEVARRGDRRSTEGFSDVNWTGRSIRTCRDTLAATTADA